MKDRECYRPSWNISEDGELHKVGIDFQSAEKKFKREERRREKDEESDGTEAKQSVKA